MNFAEQIIRRLIPGTTMDRHIAGTADHRLLEECTRIGDKVVPCGENMPYNPKRLLQLKEVHLKYHNNYYRFAP